MIRATHLKLLRPYLVGEEPDEEGEWNMRCPLHEDSKRSARLNVKKDKWYCNASCGGGSVATLIRRRKEWLPADAPAREGKAQDLDPAQVAAYHQDLLDDEGALEEFLGARALTTTTVIKYELGWDKAQGVYTIPVYGPDGDLVNLRRYSLRPRRTKIWGVEGHNRPTLYPWAVLADDPEAIIVCEGELDALATLQRGHAAITRTGAADVWNTQWSRHFAGKVVYLCHDCDDKGEQANRKVGRQLVGVAREVRVLRLPYAHVPKHGKDLTDFWRDHDPAEMEQLLEDAQLFDPDAAPPTELDPADSSVMDAFDSRRAHEPMRLTVTIKGKNEPGYTVPRELVLDCTQDYGPQCQHCPLNAAGGHDEIEVEASNPAVLEFMGSTRRDLDKLLRHLAGVPSACTKVELRVRTHQAVEVLFARPSIEHVNGSYKAAGEFKSIKITRVGGHATMPNNTVQVVGALYPNPRGQQNEFQAWEVRPLATAIDTYELDDRTRHALRRFQPQPGQAPLDKLAAIAKDLGEHVTRIRGRALMHAAMDLVWHSVLDWHWDGRPVGRGWLELLVVGDTRTGKSEAAERLMRHYSAGELVTCEAATFAGIVGGLQQHGTGKEWSITWGAYPLADRRLLILDEVSGLTTEEIARMSGIRSSGVAELTKIQSEKAPARVRAIWMGNPRDGRKVAHHAYGVQALPGLIGNPEDIARFDLAMTVSEEDVPAEEMNRSGAVGRPRYHEAICRALVRWVWSRKADQVQWAPGAAEAVRLAALDMGRRYIPDPPLVQAANVRLKIARVAVALAARLYSTDAAGELVVVRPEHVRDAVRFMDLLYGQRGFGYREVSRQQLEDAAAAVGNRKEVLEYLRGRPVLVPFFRRNHRCRTHDVEALLNVSNQEATAIINKLLGLRMLRLEAGFLLTQPEFNHLLREAKL